MSRAGLSVSMNLLVSMQISCTDSINCVSASSGGDNEAKAVVL